MNDLEDYPFAPFLNALRTVSGRTVLVCCAMIAGTVLGGITATGHLVGAWEALSGFFDLAAGSFLFGVGIIAFPLAFLFALIYIRSDWTLWTAALVVPLMWWNSHKTIHYALHESAGAKVQKQMDAILDEVAKREQVQQKSP